MYRSREERPGSKLLFWGRSLQAPYKQDDTVGNYCRYSKLITHRKIIEIQNSNSISADVFYHLIYIHRNKKAIKIDRQNSVQGIILEK